MCWSMFMRFFNGIDAPGEASQALLELLGVYIGGGEVSAPHELSQYFISAS